MDLFNLFTLLCAAVAGTAMGSFLLLTVLHKPVLSKQISPSLRVVIHARFYRLNSVLCILAGLLAALLNNQQAALVLSVVAISYVFAHMHILKGIRTHLAEPTRSENQRVLSSLYLLQNVLHFLQFMGAGYGIYLLTAG
jgi:hypothetical protein